MDRAFVGILALTLGGACGVNAVDLPDAGPGEVDADTGDVHTNLESGIELRWHLDGNIPWTIEGQDDLTVTRVSMRLEDLRLIGDATTGDERTTIQLFEPQWPTEGVHGNQFDQAPPGLYTQLRASVSQFDVRIDVTPESGDPWRLELDTESTTHQLDIPLSGVDLAVGDVEIVDIEVDISAIAQGIDLSEVDIDGTGEGEIEPGDSEFDTLMLLLETSFSQRL
jgi:hypothetical protein